MEPSPLPEPDMKGEPMRPSRLLIALTMLLLPLIVVGAAPPADDLEKLQGDWGFKGCDLGRKPGPIDPLEPLPSHPALPYFGIGPDGAGPASMQIKGRLATFSRGADLLLRIAEFRLNAAVSPRAIDLMPGTKPARGKAILGIYKLEEDKLTLCFSSDVTRPTAFKAGPGRVVLHYERAR
jgi:uncharacterized protein (TIGR03067 family)